MRERFAFGSRFREVPIPVAVGRSFDFSQPMNPVTQFVEKRAIQNGLTHAPLRATDGVSTPVLIDFVAVVSKPLEFVLIFQAQFPRPAQAAAQVDRLDHNGGAIVRFEFSIVEKPPSDWVQNLLLSSWLPKRDDF